MSGKEEKEKENEVEVEVEVECYEEDGESYRKPGGKRTRRELVTQDGGEPESKKITQKGRDGGEPEYSRQVRRRPFREEYYIEDGVGYYVVAGLHEITPREMHAYNKKVAESEGYDVETEYTNWYAAGGIGQVVINDFYRDLLNDMANLALVQYNKDQGTRLVLKEVQKANKGFCDGYKYYITFEVEDPDDQYADPVKVFQAQFVKLIANEGYRVDQIRPKLPDLCIKNPQIPSSDAYEFGVVCI